MSHPFSPCKELLLIARIRSQSRQIGPFSPSVLVDDGVSSVDHIDAHESWPKEWNGSSYEQALEEAYSLYAWSHPELRRQLKRVTGNPEFVLPKMLQTQQRLYRFTMAWATGIVGWKESKMDLFSAERHGFLYEAVTDLARKPLTVELLEAGSDIVQLVSGVTQVSAAD